MVSWQFLIGLECGFLTLYGIWAIADRTSMMILALRGIWAIPAMNMNFRLSVLSGKFLTSLEYGFLVLHGIWITPDRTLIWISGSACNLDIFCHDLNVHF